MLLIVKTNDDSTTQVEVPDFDPRELAEIVLRRNDGDVEYYVLRQIPLSAGGTTDGALDFLTAWK